MSCAATVTITGDRDLQRAAGLVRLVLTGSGRGTRLIDVFQQSPLRVLFPATGAAEVREAVFVNTAGGIAGADRLEYGVTALDGAAVILTSQAAERVYRALSEPAQIVTCLRVGTGARLAWLPQETILFNAARLRRTTELEFSGQAQVLAMESLVLGRAAHGEQVLSGEVIDTWHVKKEGRLVWADTLRITDEVFPRLHSRALLADFNALATLIYHGPDLEMRLNRVREIAPQTECSCAATVVAGLLIVRFAAVTAYGLKTGLRALLDEFGEIPGAGPFRTPKMWSC